jgi:pSer/pThr/pTyr-binding forkhead associated (FHA) protein/Mg-chelatase subunit ChlD
MRRILSILAVVVLLLVAVQAGLAQAAPLVIIHRPPDAASAPPEVRTFVAVIDREGARAVAGLTPENFLVEEDGDVIEAKSVSYETAGLAVAIVVDRGGISAPGDGRIAEAAGLAEELINRLSAPGGPGDDMVAVVGIGGEGMDPLENFTFDPVDTGRAKNALIPMVGESVTGGTPLYEGLDAALGLLTENSDGKIREALSSRRKVLVVFSDGIDPDFSETTRYDDVIRKALEADISVYTIGMGKPDRELSGADNLKRLARQTHGTYQLYNGDETRGEVLDLFDRLVTQRQQYLITYETRLPKGGHTLRVTVQVGGAAAEAEVPFQSVLQPPQISLIAPLDGDSYTVPIAYDEVECLYMYAKRENFRYDTPTVISLSAEVTPVDGASRDPAQVRYFANGELIGTGTVPPNYGITWDVTRVVTPTEQVQAREFTLVAKSEDAWLGTQMETEPVTVRVAWEAMEQTPCVEWERRVNESWWIACIAGVLGLGLFVLLIMLIRTRGELARKVVVSTSNVVKGVTKRLGGMPERGPGKLVVLKGANVGREFRLSGPVVKVGRDPRFCDFALHDDYTSNPHFSIRMEQTRYFIVDEGSTNGTLVNGASISPKRLIPLEPDAIIEVGDTRLQFKRVGGETRHLKDGAAQPPSAPEPPPTPSPAAGPQQPPPGSAAQPSTPQQPSAAESMPALITPQKPVRPKRGGPTVKLTEEEAEPKRGGPTVKLTEEEAEPKHGGPTVKLTDEEARPEQEEDSSTVKLPKE